MTVVDTLFPSRAAAATGLAAAALTARPDRRGPPRWARRAVAVALLVRAAVRGAPAARALGVHEPAETFRTLDRRLHRPFCAVLGTAVAAGSLGGGAS